MQFHRTVPTLDSLPDDMALSRSELAPFLGVVLQTLYNWSCSGKGPKITRINGRPRYLVADVRAWLKARERAA